MKDKATIKFDSKGFTLALDAVRGSKKLNWQEVAVEADVSASTISRIMMGKNPDVDSLAKLIHWCGVDFKRLIVGAGE